MCFLLVIMKYASKIAFMDIVLYIKLWCDSYRKRRQILRIGLNISYCIYDIQRVRTQVLATYYQQVLTQICLCCSLQYEFMTSLRHITLYGLMNREKDLNRWKAEHFKTLLNILTASQNSFISMLQPSSEMADGSFFKNVHVCQNGFLPNLNRAT